MPPALDNLEAITEVYAAASPVEVPVRHLIRDVLRARKDVYRSRACYKLIELNERDQLLRPGPRLPAGVAALAAGLRKP